MHQLATELLGTWLGIQQPGSREQTAIPSGPVTSARQQRTGSSTYRGYRHLSYASHDAEERLRGALAGLGTLTATFLMALAETMS